MITNYNTWDLALRCANRVLQYADGVEGILLLDDRSSESAAENIDPRVRIEVNPINLGLTRSLNRAFEILKTDVVVLFDSDAYPLNDFTGPLRRIFSANPALAAVGFRTVDETGAPTGSWGEEPNLATLVLGQRLNRWYQRLRWWRRTKYITLFTCALAIRKKAFEELGGFDPDYDWLDLDHDFCMRVNRSSWELEHLPEILAFHKGSGAPQQTSDRVLRFHKNRWRLLSKFGKVRHPRLTKALILSRLASEYALLRALRLFSSDESGALRDKLRGRRLVIRYFLRGASFHSSEYPSTEEETHELE